MKKQIFMMIKRIFAYKFKRNNEAKSINQSVKMKSEFLRIENIFEANSFTCHRIHFLSRENFRDSTFPLIFENCCFPYVNRRCVPLINYFP